MGFHAGLPAHVLVVGLLLLSVSPGSALSTRNEAQQLRGADPKTGHIMNYQIPKEDEDKKKKIQEDDSGDDSDSDDEESDAEKAADKAREEQKAKLQKSVDKAKAKLLKNLEEQAEIASNLRKAVDDAEIIANVRAVKNETESAAMAVYLGDMWKEMQTFSSPFYQEHLMERRELLEMREKVFRALLKTKKAELKRQKLAWEKEDAQEDEDDESDPEKKAEDKKKVTKLKKAEKKAEKEEEADKDAFNLMGPMPWMKDKKKEEPKEAKPTEAPVDNTVKPDWMKALDGSDDKKAKKAAAIKDDEEDDEDKEKKVKKASKAEKEDDDDEEDEEKTKKKDKKTVKDDEDDDGDEKEEKKGKKEEKKADKDDEDDDDKDDEKEAKKANKKEKKAKEDDDDDDEEEVKKSEKKKDEKASKDDEDDDDGFNIMDKPPWMKNKKKEKAAVKKEDDDEEPADDNTVKPAWMKSLEDNDDEEDTSESSSAGNKKKKSRAKAPVASGKHKPMFNKRSMPSVSPAVQCVMILAWQFFIVYTVLALLRTVNQLSQSRFPSCLRAQEMVAMLCPYVMFAPMLSVLFLATRMRAIQLTEGDTEKYGLPQWWVQSAMYAATYGVMFQAVLQLLNFILNYRIEADGSIVPIVSENRPKKVLFALAKYVFMACIYGGFTAVCIGTIFMPVPKEWGQTAPPVSAALRCTMMLTTTFFMIYLGLSVFRTAEELRPSLTNEISVFVKVQLLFWRARHAVNLAPMLCILFIVVRMRALQIDPKNGNPPWWAQAGMYLCAGAMVFQVTASILLPLIDRNAYILPGPVQGQIILVMSIKPLKILGHLIRYIPLLCMYGGASAVVASIFVMKAPKGEVTPDISATTSCIIALTTLYFVVFTAVYVAQTVLECLRESSRAKRVVTVLDAGQRTVMFAPMLCVLFIAARMRALQLTRTVDGKIPASAGPQTWVQEGMYFATGAIFLQVFLAYITTAILGAGFAPTGDDMSELRDDQHAPRSTTDDPQSKSDKRSISPNWAVAAALDIFKYLCLFAMYGGAVSCMVGIVVMTPETLPPYHQSHGVIQGLMKML